MLNVPCSANKYIKLRNINKLPLNDFTAISLLISEIQYLSHVHAILNVEYTKIAQNETKNIIKSSAWIILSIPLQ